MSGTGVEAANAVGGGWSRVALHPIDTVCTNTFRQQPRAARWQAPGTEWAATRPLTDGRCGHHRRSIVSILSMVSMVSILSPHAPA